MKTALIFGSSGLIGNYLLELILKDNNYNKIKLFVRSDLTDVNSKIEIIKTDFNNIENHKDKIVGDDCFFCIGTTRKNTPDKNEYIKTEYNIPVEVAKIAKSNSINNFIYISSLGANPNAASLYLKNKGQTEQELIKLNFMNLSILRPSILLGNRKENRVGEKIGIFAMKTLSPLFLGNMKKYKPIKVEYVAKAMFEVAQKEYLYLVNFSMFEYTSLWENGTLSPEWNDSMRTPSGILENNPLGYELFNTYIAPAISKPDVTTIRDIFQDGDVGDPTVAGSSDY